MLVDRIGTLFRHSALPHLASCAPNVTDERTKAMRQMPAMRSRRGEKLNID
jgi:hypothetical protein